MIVADKKVLTANLAKGSVEIQYKLITLYVENLNVLGTNAALIAVMTLVGLIETEYPVNGHIPDAAFSFVFYFLCLLAWIYSLLAYSEAAVSVIWGPVMALSGGTSDEVIIAVKKMKRQQNDCFRLGSLSGFFLLLATMVFTFALQGYAIGSVCGVVYLSAFYLIITHGKKVMTEFDVDKLYAENVDAEEQELDEKVAEITTQISSKLGVAHYSAEDAEDEKRELNYEAIIEAKTKELNDIRGRGIMWMKPENTNCFKRMYLVAQKGCLEFYETESDFLDVNTNMKNETPLELNKYLVEKNIRKINAERHQRYSATAAMRNLVMGSNELSYLDNMSADFDTGNAIKNCKFSLIPKHLTEMEKVEVVHFMAEDGSNYSEWMKILKKINKINDEIGVVTKALLHSRGADVTRSAVEKAASAHI